MRLGLEFAWSHFELLRFSIHSLFSGSNWLQKTNRCHNGGWKLVFSEGYCGGPDANPVHAAPGLSAVSKRALRRPFFSFVPS